MTSSLVGSEMCIRDSNRAGTGDEGGRKAKDRDQGKQTRSTMDATSPEYSCLLYTSDAADDM
eukprot:551228-Prorocentrum_lima.AAC.1